MKERREVASEQSQIRHRRHSRPVEDQPFFHGGNPGLLCLVCLWLASSAKQSAKSKASDFFNSWVFLSYSCLAPFASRLSNHPVRSCQHIRRDRKADLLCRFQVDDELELYRPFHREIGGLGTLQNLVYVGSGAPVQDDLPLRDDLLIRYRTAWNRGICVGVEHEENSGQDKSDVFLHELIGVGVFVASSLLTAYIGNSS